MSGGHVRRLPAIKGGGRSQQWRVAEPVSSAEPLVPSRPGLYAIFVDRCSSLPEPFSADLAVTGSTLIYLGKAGSSLRARLVDQDLNHKSPSTFFRGIGAVLGYRPPAGSKAKGAEKNYTFSDADERKIVEWIYAHLLISWVELEPGEPEDVEPGLIRGLCPLFNTVHNPKAHPELARLRALCRAIAASEGSHAPRGEAARRSQVARAGRGEGTTPEELAAELGISAKTLRAWLRTNYAAGHVRNERWRLTADQVAAARRRFAGNARRGQGGR
jgi:hypothetical protein